MQANYLLERLQLEPDLIVSFQPHNPRLPGILHLLQSVKYLRTLVTTTVYVLSLLFRVPRYDVIHIFSASYFSFVLAPTPAILIAKLFSKKVILNYRSGEAEDHLRTWPRTSLPIIKLVDRLVVPSEYLVNVFSKFGLRAQSISNIVDTQKFTFRSPRKLRPLFLSNRNLYPLYNVGCILRAFGLIQTEFPDAKLTVAGDGSERPALEWLAQQLKLDNVEFIGLVNPERMSDLYESSDIYLNGSDIDNMPGSILEAFACGLPVVTTNAGGIPYIVEHGKTGLMVPRNDHEAMAAAAISLLRNRELADQIISHSADACANYTWPAVRERWKNLYVGLSTQRVSSLNELPLGEQFDK